jgi:putative DNA primase/helicase
MPRLEISPSGPIHEQEEIAWEALMAQNDSERPQVMRRGSALVRLGADGALDDYRRASMTRRLSQVAAWVGDSGGAVPEPPARVVLDLLDADDDEHPGAPHVERVTQVPTVGADFSVVDRPGHHEAQRVWYEPADGLGGVAPAAPETTEDVEEARDFLIEDYLGDFGFVDEASRAHALGLLLLPFVRDAIDGPTPQHVITAPDMGSGKTLLAQACLLPGCGDVPAQSITGIGEAEIEKRLTSMMLAGRTAAIFDNLTGELRSSALAAALTSATWEGRVLGESRSVTLPIRTIWALTGTNVRLAEDQVRRAVPIFLDPGEVRPADRPAGAFRHPNLTAWGRANRRELVAAALTLVEHWRLGPAPHVEGGYVYHRNGDEPARGRQTLGSYESWAQVIGGILDACGMGAHFLGNRGRLRDEAADGAEDVADFLAAWHSLGLGQLTTGELGDAFIGATLPNGDAMRLHIPPEIGQPGRDRDFVLKLGNWCRDHRNRRRGGYVLRMVEGRRNAWGVARVGDGEGAP